MSKKAKAPKTLKEILSTDYHIPGISPRFYLPVCLLAFAVVVAYIIWTPDIVIPQDLLFIMGVSVILAVSAISTAAQRILKFFRKPVSLPDRRRPPAHKT
jgi:hypothetical protein